jgi:hypothetical protein
MLAVLSAALFSQGCATKSEDDDGIEAAEPSEPVESEKSTSAAEQAASPEADPQSGADGMLSNSTAVPSTSSPTAQPPSPAPSSSAAMSGGNRVMYVKVNGAVMRETPDPKGQSAGVLEKGDHFLVTVEGDWARTDTGKYISLKVLSEKGIARDKKKAHWSGGHPSAPKKVKAKKEKKSKNVPVKTEKAETTEMDKTQKNTGAKEGQPAEASPSEDPSSQGEE